MAGEPTSSPDPGRPPARLRLTGQALTALVVRFPAAWPLVRGPVRRFFDRTAAGWDTRVRTDEERMAPLAAALEAVEAQPRRILDLGTGTGAAALWLARGHPEASVTGVDLSERMIEGARAKLRPEHGERVDFAVADAAALPYPDGAFDLVVQVSMPVFFNELARVLAPGGHAVIVSSLGKDTPFHTPRRLLERGFARRGMETVATGKAGVGSFVVAAKHAR